MNLKISQLYLFIIVVAISLLIGCTSGNNNTSINQINRNLKLYNKNRFSNKNSGGVATASASEGDDGNIQIYKDISRTILVVEDIKYKIFFPTGFLPEGAQVSYIIPLVEPYDYSSIRFLLLLINSPTVYFGEANLEDYKDDKPISVKYLGKYVARNSIAGVAVGSRNIMVIDISNVYIICLILHIK